jgi:hypothetical protein
MASPDFLYQVQAVVVGENEIDHHQVRLIRPEGRQGCLAGGDGALDSEIGLGLDKGGQPAA